MNKEDYVSLEVAKLLKEKGFDYATLYYYEKSGKLGMMNLDAQSQMRKHGYMNDIYPRPTLYEAQKWLRNKYKLHIDVGMCGDYATDADGNKVEEWDFWTFDVYYTENFSHHIFDCFGQYDTYEEALNAGILEALKLI